MSTRSLSLLALTVVLAACQPAAPAANDAATSSSSSAAAVTSSSEAMAPAVPFSGARSTFDLATSSIDFVGGSSLGDHEGTFETFTATLTLDKTTPADLSKASFSTEIDLTSVKTDAAKLDEHLQAPEFFDTATSSKATFVSKEIKLEAEDGANHYDIVGDLTIKGKTVEVEAEAIITDAGIEAEFDLPRKELGIGNESYGDKLLDEMVPVTVTLMFQKA